MYVSYEDHIDEVTRRSQAIARELKLSHDGTAQYWDLSGTDSPLAIIHESGACELQPFWNRLLAYLRAIDGHKFVVFDSTYNVLRFGGQAKINEASVMLGIGVLQRLCNETDSTVLALWHPSQAGQERGDSSGWSVAWHNAPRARLSLTPVKNSDDAYDLKTEKRNHGPKGKAITLYWSDGILMPRSDASESEHTARLERTVIRVALKAAESGVPIQLQRRITKWQLDEIEQETGRRPSQAEIRDALGLAARHGRLRYIRGTGRRSAGYYPPDMERATELARDAKQQNKSGGGNA
jgi:RecA-family ATPase